MAKLAYLRNLGADRLDLRVVPPERLRQLATLARRSTPSALRQMTPERRHPILLAALAAGRTEIVDEVVRIFDQALAGTDSRARFKVAERQAELVKADVERLVLLDDILGVVLDTDLDDAAVGSAVRSLGPERLARAARGDDDRLPRDNGHLDLMEASFAHVRSFAPQVLAALTFAASVAPSEVLEAVRLLQTLNAEGRRHVPETAPTGFVPARWQPYLDAAWAAGDENRFKHYWELCVLFALQGGLRSGEIWVEGSRRYANPASYLIDPETWHLQRPELLSSANRPTTQPRRSPQRPTPVHLLRPPRHRPLPPPRRPDHPSALPHPRRQRLTSCRPPAISTTPSTPSGLTATPSATRPSPTSASPTSTPTERSASTSPASSTAPADPYGTSNRR